MTERDNSVTEAAQASRGAITRLFGAILIILAGLSIMLSWRGGFQVAPFHGFLMVAGIFLSIIGAVQRQKGLDADQCAGNADRGA